MFLQKLSRKKYIDLSAPSNLKRCLGVLDLTALGVGATLGVGTYVLAGSIAKNEAGPAVVLSMAIAAFASVFAGFESKSELDPNHRNEATMNECCIHNK